MSSTHSEQAVSATVQPFTREMILQFLKQTGVKYMVDSDGDYVIHFGYNSETDCQLPVMLIASGSNNQIYVVRILADKRIPREQWGEAVMLCNAWNRERRWPKAFLNVDDPTSDTFGHIYLEQQIDFEKGVHQELLDDFTGTMLSAGHAFWVWAHNEQGL